VEEKKYNFILHIGPRRTGTTYLYDLFHQSPLHIRQKIMPVNPFEMLDKHLQRLNDNKITPAVYQNQKMLLKEDGLHLGEGFGFLESFFNSYYSFDILFDNFFKRFEHRLKDDTLTEYLYVTRPNFLHFMDPEKMFLFFKNMSMKFKTVYIITGFRPIVETVESLANYVSYTGLENANYSNESETTIFQMFEQTIKEYSNLTSFTKSVCEKQCCGANNLHIIALDHLRLNNSEYMYNKFNWLWESEQQLQEIEAFGKKSNASNENQTLLYHPATTKFKTEIQEHDEFLDKYIYAN